MIRRLEWVAAVGLTVSAIFFHVARLHFAGALWRDETAALNLARLPSIHGIVKNFQHEAFPILFPMTVRVYTTLFGDSDRTLRVLGLFVGLGIVGTLWLNAWINTKTPPLISLALVEFNAAFILWGDSLRGYGIGSLFALLTLALVTAVATPSLARRRVMPHSAPAWLACLAVGSALLGVHYLFYNSVLLAAVCGAAMLAILLDRPGVLPRPANRRTLIILTTILAVSGVSVLPYIAPLQHAQEWSILVQRNIDLHLLLARCAETLGSALPAATAVWLLLVLAAVALALLPLREPAATLSTMDAGAPHAGTLASSRSDRGYPDLFPALAIVGVLTGYFSFLMILSYPTAPWYYLALMASLAGLLDLAFQALTWSTTWRVLRLVVVLATAGAVTLPLLHEIRQRQTDIDLIAREVQEHASPADVVVLAVWHPGISFARYYHGAAPWTTVPPMSFHLYHRYDLIREAMTRHDQDENVRPVLNAMAAVLKSGHRVWLITPRLLEAGERPRILPAAPAGPHGWQDLDYILSWGEQTLSYVQTHARTFAAVTLKVGAPISPMENLSLFRAEGWRESAKEGHGVGSTSANRR